MTPVGTAIALPPCASDRVGPHPQPHAELENTGECAGARHRDDQPLEYADSRVRLHDPHQAQNGRGRHEAVGIERQCEIMARAVSLAEILDVARLEPFVGLAPAVSQCDAIAPRHAKRLEAGSFGLGDGSVVGIAQHIDMKTISHARALQTQQDEFKIARDTLRQLVAHAGKDCGAREDRIRRSRLAGAGKHRDSGVTGQHHDEKADRGVPEADHCPRQGQGKQREKHHAGRRKR